jgi:hypothetical protein
MKAIAQEVWSVPASAAEVDHDVGAVEAVGQRGLTDGPSVGPVPPSTANV